MPHGPTSYVCSPLYPVMNASFILAGVLTIVGAVLLQRIWPDRKLATAALVLWIITGLGKILLALYPENTNLNLHLLGALNIPVESIAILLISLSILRMRPTVGVVGLAVAILGLLGTVLGIAAEIVGPAAYLGLGVGGMERVADSPGSLWMLLIGGLAVASSELCQSKGGPTAGPRSPDRRTRGMRGRRIRSRSGSLSCGQPSTSPACFARTWAASG